MPSCGVCLSVCLSRSYILSKRINISLIFSPSGRYPHHSIFSVPNVVAIFWREPPNAGGVEKVAILGQYLAMESMTAGRANNCDGLPGSLSHRPSRISEYLFITTSMDDHDEEKRTEQNLFLRSGKCEAEVTTNRRLRSPYCSIEANYWQTWSIATAGPTYTCL